MRFKKGQTPWNKGIPHSEATKKKISNKTKGVTSPMKGQHHSEETKRKIGIANKGKKSTLGFKFSEESKHKMSLAKKGKPSFMLGKHWTEEAKLRLSLAKKGKSFSPEHQAKLNAYHIGRKLSEETKEKCRLASTGKKHTEETKQKLHNINLGKKMSKETNLKNSIAHRGEKSSNWKGGITPITAKVRNSFEYSSWRQAIFIRDNFTCKKCGATGVYLEAHHKKPFSELVQLARDSLPLFDLFQACMVYSPIWDINNGETLCKDCHKNTGLHKKINKNNYGGNK
jgi:5-methylcytosine-specific restriction endonuclease McrA